MWKDSASKYRAFRPVGLTDHTWPDRVITAAPQWCSVDLRYGQSSSDRADERPAQAAHVRSAGKDGIQGNRGGVSCSITDHFDFVREQIERNLVPDDVTIQVLTQARPELVARTFESLRGASRAIVHLYNSTSTVQRRVVFGLDRAGIVDIAVNGARCMVEHARQQPATVWTFEYSPESFTGTELAFAVEICDAIVEVWRPTSERKVVQAVTDATGKELTSEQIWELFQHEYLDREGPYCYSSHQLTTPRDRAQGEALALRLTYHGQAVLLHGEGNGPIDALMNALGLQFDVLSCEERSINIGGDACAVAFVEITTPMRTTCSASAFTTALSPPCCLRSSAP
jgi:hypothetical protein